MADITNLVEELSKLTVIEAADLVKQLETKWGVSAAAPVAVAAAGGAAAGGAAPAAAAKDTFDVILASVPADKKIAVIKVVREVKAGLGLAEAKALVEGAPKPVLENLLRIGRHAIVSFPNFGHWEVLLKLLLNGKMLTGRDAAHKRIQDMLAKGEKLPVDFTNRVIYYVGPVDPVGNEAVGPAGPTTATRMDKFTEMMLAQTGLISMVGKAERGPTAIEAIKKHQSAYLMAVGGAAYLVSKAIQHAKVVGFADLGMEAIYEFDVVDMPVTVAVDAGGTSAHITGPAEWQKRIASGEFKGIGVTAA